MAIKNYILSLLPFLIFISVNAQKSDPYKSDFSFPEEIPGMKMVWHDEFNYEGKPDSFVES